MTRRLDLDFRPSVTAGVRFDDLGHAVRLTATTDLVGLATGRFADPSASVALEIAGLADAELLGYAFTQFAMPVRASAGKAFDFHPAHDLHAPPVVIPLVIRDPEGRVLLLAPLDAWHEQVIAVQQDDRGVVGLRWGWHGDLDRVPAGFSSTLGLYDGASVAEVFERWGHEIRTVPERPRSDPLLTHLSYWTDNGAAYWYRTEPGRDLADTLAAKVAELDDLGTPVGAVELDSWFYPHEISRPVTEVGYLPEVPPTGMLEWTPRPEVLPDGVDGLAERLGRHPLVLHSRHISPASPYLDEGDWWVDLAAHPVDQRFFDRWVADAAAWGATCIEQDWMMITWFGVHQIREEPGRAGDWQRALDRAAGRHGLSLLWCMATPADLVATVGLANVVAVRTCDDYRFAADPAILWHWYLTVNRLADALGLATFKDCFFSMGGDGIDGDPHPEIEALLSAMSAGVVGVGDRIGRTDPAVLRRVALADGSLVTSDRPLALTDRSFFRSWDDDGVLCWSTASSGDWTYVVALHTAAGDRPIRDTLRLDRERLVYDWRAESATPSSSIDVELAPRDWALFVCCPIDVDADGTRQSLVGDPSVFVTMGSTRVRRTGDGVELLLADGESSAVLRRWIDGVGLVDEHVAVRVRGAPS